MSSVNTWDFGREYGRGGFLIPAGLLCVCSDQSGPRVWLYLVMRGGLFFLSGQPRLRT